MKKIIIFILVLVFAAGGVFYFIKNSNFTETSEVDEVNFSSFEDDKFSFTFDYPKEWGNPEIVLLSTKVSGTFINGSIRDSESGFSFSEGVYYDQSNQKKLTIEEIVSNIKKQTYIKQFSQEDFVVGGKKGIKIEYGYSTGNTMTELYIPLDEKGNIFNISSEVELVGAPVFKKVVDSIEFKKEKSVDTKPLNTKKYISSNLGLEFSHSVRWYPYEEDRSLMLLQKSSKPDVGETEGYAYGSQITVSTSGITTFDGMSLSKSEYEQYILSLKELDGKPVKSSAVVINNIPMLRLDFYEYVGSYRVLYYEILKGDMKYTIRLYPYRPESSDIEDKKNIEDFEALVKTLKIN